MEKVLHSLLFYHQSKKSIKISNTYYAMHSRGQLTNNTTAEFILDDIAHVCKIFISECITCFMVLIMELTFFCELLIVKVYSSFRCHGSYSVNLKQLNCPQFGINKCKMAIFNTVQQLHHIVLFLLSTYNVICAMNAVLALILQSQHWDQYTDIRQNK